jgi:molecular chaperone HtpG
MRVLGEALYSTPHVAIRELVQNAHDSCARRALESAEAFTPAITVTSTQNALYITDNGAGLTESEIHAYLATVGAGYTRTLRDAGKGEGMIGYFGLGFLSAFAVSEKVEVWTTSYQTPNLGHRFVSRSGETYTVEVAEPRPVGTELKLTLRDEVPELADATVVRLRLQRYCCLLKYPVTMSGEVINATPPPWRLPTDMSPLRRKTLSLEFARQFERVFEPIATIPVVNDELELAGLLWVQDGGSYASSDNRNVSVFVRGMLIGEDERDLLPRWAGFFGGVIESKQLQPTASREALRKDEAFDKAAAALRLALIEALSKIAESEPETWRRILSRHNEALLGAALVDDDLFRLVSNDVTVPTTEGDLTLPAVLARSGNKVHVTQGERAGVESILLRAIKLPVVLGTRFAAAPFCARFVRQQRGELVMLGTSDGDKALFRAPEFPEGDIARLASWFAAPDRQVLVRAFDPAFLPFALVIDRDAELKRRLESDDADRRIGHAVLGLARQFTKQLGARELVRMYVNAANPMIRALLTAPESDRTRALALMQPLAALAAGSEGGADLEAAMKTFSAALLGTMAGHQ